MVGVQDDKVIDLVAHGADGASYVLVMIEDRPWSTSPVQKHQLRQKFNLYASYIVDGELAATYPETADKPIAVQLNCKTAPEGEILDIIEKARVTLAEKSVPVLVHVFG
jgi:hypothetical protein